MQVGRQRSSRNAARSRAVELDEPVAIAESMDSKIADRLNVLDELLNTERDYLTDLTTTVNKYLIPMRTERLVSVEAIQKIFVNIESIKELHNDIYNELEEKISDIRLVSSIEYCISDIFSKNAENLKNYVTFSTKYTQAIAEVSQQKEKSSSFAQFLDKTQLDDPQNLRLADYLIKPIQRLCKYPLIFRELLKSTPEDHKDREFMQETMSSLQALTTHVNECNQQAENEAQLQQIESGITGLDCRLAVPGRELIKDGNVWIAQEKEKQRARRLIVFSDILIIAKVKSKKQHTCVTSIESNSLLFVPISSIPTADCPTSPGTPPKPERKGSRMIKRTTRTSSASLINLLPAKPELCFQLIDLIKKIKYTVQCADERTKLEWEEALKKCASSDKEVIPVEEQLKREQDARKKLQETNAELRKRIKELEKSLEEESNLRKSLQDQLKTKT